MAYLVASQLAALLPAVGTITGSSVPLSIDEVATMIARVSAEIDGAAAAAGYAMPVPPPASGGPTTAYAQLEQICEDGSSWKVLRTFFPAMGGPGDKSSFAAECRDAYTAALKALRKGELPLVGAPSSSGSEGRVLPRSNYTTDGTGASPIMDMDWEP